MTDIQIDVQAPVARVILNRPDKRNAVSAAMWQSLLDLAGSLPGNGAVKAVLLSGAGTQAFSAGADIAEMQRNLQHPETMRAMQQVVQDACSSLDAASSPTGRDEAALVSDLVSIARWWPQPRGNWWPR